MTTVREALDRLRAAAASGALESLCRRHDIRVLTAFGSVVHGNGEPGDLDVGIAFEPRAEGDLIAVVNALIEFTGSERVDVMDIGRASPVARSRALIGVLPLYESEPGAYAQAQMAAAVLEWDTAWMRRLALESLTR